MSHHLSARCEFLRFLAASPLAAQALAQNPTGPYTPAYMAPAFGKEGMERVLDILRDELTLTMRQCGTPTLAQITRASILRNGTRI